MNDTCKQPQNDHSYLRVQIAAKLKTRSPLHCGDGAELAASSWNSTTPVGSEGHINTVCQGVSGPYIPASTLRGSLRERCPETQRQQLFGSARGDGSAGKVRVYDAPVTQRSAPQGDGFWNRQRGTTIRNGVSLDAVTSTAADSKLFQFEVVPEGSLAEVHIEAERLDQDGLALLLGLIQSWEGDAASALGRGRSRGWGRVQTSGEPSVETLTEADVVSWLGTACTSPPSCTPLSPSPTAATLPGNPLQHLSLRLVPSSPVLVNQPGRVLPSDKDKKKDERQHNPAVEVLRDADGTAVIPGSSLRGALRARAARILATLVFDNQPPSGAALGKAIAEPLDILFGTEQWRSLLWVGEARASGQQFIQQHFNAVDRFTGGVAKGALYAANAVDCAHFTVDIQLDRARSPAQDWWKGLLLFLARDLMEGDIPLGWGRSRGFGSMNALLLLDGGVQIGTFDELLKHLQSSGAGNPQQWVQALLAKADELRQNASQGGAL